jgi:predicted transcriptional regulator
MTPISVQVPEEQKLMLRVLAVKKNTSMSVLMREALDEYITRSSLYFVKSP